MLKLLQLITPVHEYEERVPSRFLGIIKGKITKNSGALQRDVSHISPPDFPYVPSAVLLTELELPSEVTKFAQLVWHSALPTNPTASSNLIHRGSGTCHRVSNSSISVRILHPKFINDNRLLPTDRALNHFCTFSTPAWSSILIRRCYNVATFGDILHFLPISLFFISFKVFIFRYRLLCNFFDKRFFDQYFFAHSYIFSLILRSQFEYSHSYTCSVGSVIVCPKCSDRSVLPEPNTFQSQSK